MEPLTHKEVHMIATRSHLTGEQQSSIIADLRAKWGTNVLEPHLQEEMPLHNQQYAGYFSVEEKQFLDSDGNLNIKHLFFCHDTLAFLKEVCATRSLIWEQVSPLLQGDSGQGYTKLLIGLLRKYQLEKTSGVRISSAGVLFQQEQEEEVGGSVRKKRRTHEEGVGGGQDFKDWGSRKLLLVAIAHKVPENHHNLQILFEAIQIGSFPCKITGDFAIITPWLGLVKGCGGSNPCPICDIRRTKEGQAAGQARWMEELEVNLQT